MFTVIFMDSLLCPFLVIAILIASAMSMRSSVAILRGGLGGPCPPQIFLNFKIVWLTYAGLPNAFCSTGHFVNRARSKQCRNSLAAQGKQRDNQYCQVTVNDLPVVWLTRYISVCV